LAQETKLDTSFYCMCKTDSTDPCDWTFLFCPTAWFVCIVC